MPAVRLAGYASMAGMLGGALCQNVNVVALALALQFCGHLIGMWLFAATWQCCTCPASVCPSPRGTWLGLVNFPKLSWTPLQQARTGARMSLVFSAQHVHRPPAFCVALLCCSSLLRRRAAGTRQAGNFPEVMESVRDVTRHYIGLAASCSLLPVVLVLRLVQTKHLKLIIVVVGSSLNASGAMNLNAGGCASLVHWPACNHAC